MARDEEELGPRSVLAPAVAASVGVVLISVADAGTRSGASVVGSWAYWLFWFGLLLIFTPAAFLACSKRLSPSAGLLLVIVVAIAIYLVKLAYGPSQVNFSDEFAHWRSAHDILATKHLFHHNPLIPVAAKYPGLALITTALVRLAGVSISTGEFIVIGAARLIITIALFWILARLSRSPRVSTLGSLLYMAHPNYAYFDAQAAYESLALPLALLAISLVLRVTGNHRESDRVGAKICAVALIGSVAIIHHLTSYALAGALTMWAVIAAVRTRSSTVSSQASVWWAASVAILTAGLWLLLAAPTTIGYVGPVFSRAVNQTIQVALGTTQSRTLYSSASGQVAPLWERGAGFAGVLLILLFLGLRPKATLRLARSHPFGALLVLAAALFPVVLVLRFVPDAQETANRSSAYVFVGIAVVAGANLLAASVRSRRFAASSATALVVIFIGGLTSAWAFYQRMPSMRSPVPLTPTPTNVAAAYWMERHEGRNNIVAADKIDRLAQGSFGNQDPVFGANGNVPVWAVFIPRTVNTAVAKTIALAGIRFVVVDQRLADGPPPQGGYFDAGEPMPYGPTHPIPSASLTKFDRDAAFDRIYDNGLVQVFRVPNLGALNNRGAGRRARRASKRLQQSARGGSAPPQSNGHP